MSWVNILIIVLVIASVLYICLSPCRYKKLTSVDLRKKEKKTFKFEEPNIHTVVYGVCGSGNLYFVKEYIDSFTTEDKDRDKIEDRAITKDKTINGN